MWGENDVSFDKDKENDNESVDWASKNSEDAPFVVHPFANSATPPFVQPTTYIPPSPPVPPLNSRVPSSVAHVSSPTAYVSSHIIALTTPIVVLLVLMLLMYFLLLFIILLLLYLLLLLLLSSYFSYFFYY